FRRNDDEHDPMVTTKDATSRVGGGVFCMKYLASSVLPSASDRWFGRPAIEQPAEETLYFADLPRHQHLGGVEDGRIRSGDDTDQEGEHEVLRRPTTEEVERQQREDHGDRGVE